MSELDRANNANRAQVDRINGLEKEAEAGRIAATAGELESFMGIYPWHCDFLRLSCLEPEFCYVS